MEFIKVGDKYIIKDSCGIIVDEKEKQQLEKRNDILKDIMSNECQDKRKKKKNKKVVEEKIVEEDNDAIIEETTVID